VSLFYDASVSIRPRAAELAAGRRPGKKWGLTAGKVAAYRQPGRKNNAAKPPPILRLKAALPRNVNKTLAV